MSPHELPGLEPVARDFGNDRGGPLDRWYVHHYLWPRREDVRGRVLEIGDSAYTSYLGEGRVERVDVLHAVPGNPDATFVGDLVTGENVPLGVYDCIILTQTLHLIYDVWSAVRTAHAALAPGGVVLATLAGICAIGQYDRRDWGDYWRFTGDSARRLFGEPFGDGRVEVTPYGNVFAATAFLYGYADHELTEDELLHRDSDYELLLGVRAVREPER